jgi:hypothetical protein
LAPGHILTMNFNFVVNIFSALFIEELCRTDLH